ncbi:MAG: class I SAM-dependent methyltransferase [Oscillospiraceae bacterium]|nr:class I SAM-dependent methyltransferase [Oscillospiraceae bacterium]
MSKLVNEKNIERFSGFPDLYNNSRPTPPEIIKKIILLYFKNKPEVVVDIGSGTGLSTLIWSEIAQNIIGIEPNDEMRATAEKNSKSDNIVYYKGVSNQTNLPSDYADIITISQAFHWMDIDSTLFEVYRVLKNDGVLAIFDCDWPPSIDWVIEEAYLKLRNTCVNICSSQEKTAIINDRSTYINMINSFGKFRFLKEIMCHNIERCTPQRMIGFALSQGAIQVALKIDTSIKNDVDEFCYLVNSLCQNEFDIVFSYRLRVAVK